MHVIVVDGGNARVGFIRPTLASIPLKYDKSLANRGVYQERVLLQAGDGVGSRPR